MTTTTENLIRARFDEKIAQTLDYPVFYEGAPGYMLKGQPVSTPTKGIWLKYSLRLGDSVQRDFGSVQAQTEGTPGVMIIQVNCDAGTGDKKIREVAEQIRAQFRRLDLNGVTFRTPRKGNPRRRGKWWGLAVKCPFTIFESTAPSEV